MSLQVVSVATRTDLKALSTTTTSAAILTEANREGTFILRTGSPPASDPQEAIFVTSNTSGYYWEREFTGGASLLWFGADPNYGPTVNNWTPFQSALDLCAALGGVPLYIPEGRYGFTAAPEIKVDAFRTSGLLIYGDGQQRTILDLRSVTTSPNLQVHCATSPTVKDNYYLTLRDFGVIGQIAGTVLQVGADDFSDPVNMPRFQNLTVQNFDSSASCIAVKMNYVVGGWFDIQVNGGATGENGGLGTALVLRQCQFNHFFGSVGTADTALRLQDGVNASNVFNCLDMENVNTCVVAASGNISANTFIGGTWSYTTTGIDAVAGVSTYVINPTPAPTAGGTLANFLDGVTGLVVQSRGILPVSSPSLPASGTAITNTYAQAVNVAIWGGSISAITINGFGYGIASGFVVLEPGDTIALSYSSAPVWVWRA